MVNFKSSVVNDLLAGFGAKSVEVFGDTDIKPPRVGIVLFSMLKPIADPNLGELTPTYQCNRVPGQGEAGATKSYQKYFKYGSAEYNLFIAAAKKQCQASQLKIQGK
jgi:hypothetical protein